MTHSHTKICLFGGSFDPIHHGHTFIAAEAVRTLSLDKVIFLPCKQSPHKLSRDYTCDAHRLQLCRLATQNLSWAEVSDYELLTPAPSFSWRTAEYMHEKFPDAELYWLMGTDQWQNITSWARHEHLASLVKFIVFTRGSVPTPHPDHCFTLIRGSHPASATSIRLHPQSPSATAWLHPSVYSYIHENHLYPKSILDSQCPSAITQS